MLLPVCGIAAAAGAQWWSPGEQRDLPARIEYANALGRLGIPALPLGASRELAIGSEVIIAGQGGRDGGLGLAQPGRGGLPDGHHPHPVGGEPSGGQRGVVSSLMYLSTSRT